MNEKLELQLNNYLSNISVMYTKLHNLHWNVKGPRFKSVHEYLETLYDSLSGVFDEVAEVIIMQNATPLASLKDFLANSSIEEIESRDYKENEVISITLDDMKKIKNQVEIIRLLASEEDNYSVVSMLEEQLNHYSKTIWFLESMLK